MKIVMMASILAATFIAQADTGEKFLGGFDPSRDLISQDYTAGAYLIYNCKDQHWVCVTEEDYLECENKWQKGEKASLSTSYECAPIEKFPTKKSCFQRVLFNVSQNLGTRFCQKES